MAALTSDNPHLSELTVVDLPDQLVTTFAVNCKRAEEGAEADVAERVRRLVQAATSPNTRRAYRSDLAHFLANGGKLPATPTAGAGSVEGGDQLDCCDVRQFTAGRARPSFAPDRILWGISSIGAECS